MRTIRQTADFHRWFVALRDQRAKDRILARLRRMELGNPGDTKSVGEGIIEMRIDYGPGYRVYYAQREYEIVLLLCGGDKKTQERDIVRAKALARDIQE